MKLYKRVLGIDDGPFDRASDLKVSLVGVLARFDGYIEGVAKRTVTVDGMDSTDTVVSFFDAHFGSQIDYVMTNGITVAGFNILDIADIYDRTGKPVISVTRKEPDVDSMVKAIRKHFEDSERRIGILTSLETKEIQLDSSTTLFANLAGIELPEALEALQKSTIRGNIPEPIRLAHMIAGAIKNGENRGKV